MKSTEQRQGGVLRSGLAPLTIAVAMMSAGASGPARADYSEIVSGDLSSVRTAPTAVTFDLGSNVIQGNSGSAGGPPDRDYFTFTLGAGQQLTSIYVLRGTASLGRTFFGIATGTQMPVDPEAGSAVGLLGWTLFSAADTNTDILDDLGASAPPNFPSFPGATGFTPPLGPGSYTAWIQDGDPGVSSYLLDFNVASVPEPGTWALMLAGFGSVGWQLRRKPTRARAMNA